MEVLVTIAKGHVPPQASFLSNSVYSYAEFSEPENITTEELVLRMATGGDQL